MRFLIKNAPTLDTNSNPIFNTSIFIQNTQIKVPKINNFFPAKFHSFRIT